MQSRPLRRRYAPPALLLLVLGGCASCPSESAHGPVEDGTPSSGTALADGGEAEGAQPLAAGKDAEQDAAAPMEPPATLPGPDAPPASMGEIRRWLDHPDLDGALVKLRDDDRLGARQMLAAWVDAPDTANDPRTPHANLVIDLIDLERLLAGDTTEPAPDAASLVSSLQMAAEAFPLIGDRLRADAARANLVAGEAAAALAATEALVGSDDAAAAAAAREVRLEARAALGHGHAVVDALKEVFAQSPEALGAAELHHLVAHHRDGPPRGAVLALATRFAADPRALEAIEGPARETLTEDERVAVAEAMLEAGRHATARALVAGLLPPGRKDALGCRAGLVHGLSLERSARRKDRRAQATSAAFLEKLAGACDGEAGAWATFLGGRNRARAARSEKTPKARKKATTTARRLLVRHVEGWPSRSTFDDALDLLAELEVEPADAEARRWKALREMPRGDMAEAHAWALAGPHIEAGMWPEALAVLDKVLEVVPGGPASRHGGRFAYWRAVALSETGADAEAQRVFADIQASFPLSYYAVLALSRLCYPDADCARRRLAEAAGLADDASPLPAGAPLTTEAFARIWATPAFRRAVSWARLLGHAHTTDAFLHDRVMAALDEVPLDVRRGDGAADAWFLARAGVLHLAGSWAVPTASGRSFVARDDAPWPKGEAVHLWRAAYPRPFHTKFADEARARGVEEAWLLGIARVESNFNPRAVSWANAIGLMQINPPTAEFLARGTGIDPTPENLKRPEIAIALGTKYLAKLLDQHGQIPLASAGYNAGGGAVSRWRREFGEIPLDRFVERIPYDEARNYARSVTQTMARYLWLYEARPVLLRVEGTAGPAPAAPEQEEASEPERKEEGAPQAGDGVAEPGDAEPTEAPEVCPEGGCPE
jgi:soluble lytic murein transglycosylase-like protein